MKFTYLPTYLPTYVKFIRLKDDDITFLSKSFPEFDITLMSIYCDSKIALDTQCNEMKRLNKVMFKIK